LLIFDNRTFCVDSGFAGSPGFEDYTRGNRACQKNSGRGIIRLRLNTLLLAAGMKGKVNRAEAR
jgi:hypothetical protein